MHQESTEITHAPPSRDASSGLRTLSLVHYLIFFKAYKTIILQSRRRSGGPAEKGAHIYQINKDSAFLIRIQYHHISYCGQGPEDSFNKLRMLASRTLLCILDAFVRFPEIQDAESEGVLKVHRAFRNAVG